MPDRKFFLVAACLWAQMAPAIAITGNEWRAQLEGKQVQFATGYLQGVVEARGTWWAAAGERALAETYNGGKLFLPRFCTPAGWSMRQATSIIKRWMDEHPAKTHEDFTQIVDLALTDAWPCPDNPNSSH